MADAYYAVATGVPGAPYVDLVPDPPSRWRALRLVALCLAAGVASRALYDHVASDPSLEPATTVRYAFATTIGLYAVVAALLVRTVRGRVDWRATPLNALAGAALGGGLAYVLLEGDLAQPGDARVALLVSEASFANVAATVLLTVVAAPLCEELLFRGVLMPSLGDRAGHRLAVWGSALAFAAWHLNAGLMLTYTLFGVLFGALALRRGLACSTAAHAAFNGMLVLAAVTYATGPGVAVRVHDVVLTAPAGWHGLGTTTLSGPSDARVFVVARHATLDTRGLADRLAAGTIDTGGLDVDESTARVETLRVGDVVRARYSRGGRDGELAAFVLGGRVYWIELLSGGSPRVRADFDTMLRDLRARS